MEIIDMQTAEEEKEREMTMTKTVAEANGKQVYGRRHNTGSSKSRKSERQRRITNAISLKNVSYIAWRTDMSMTETKWKNNSED